MRRNRPPHLRASTSPRPPKKHRETRRNRPPHLRDSASPREIRLQDSSARPARRANEFAATRARSPPSRTLAAPSWRLRTDRDDTEASRESRSPPGSRPASRGLRGFPWLLLRLQPPVEDGCESKASPLHL